MLIYCCNHFAKHTNNIIILHSFKEYDVKCRLYLNKTGGKDNESKREQAVPWQNTWDFLLLSLWNLLCIVQLKLISVGTSHISRAQSPHMACTHDYPKGRHSSGDFTWQRKCTTTPPQLGSDCREWLQVMSIQDSSVLLLFDLVQYSPDTTVSLLT